MSNINKTSVILNEKVSFGIMNYALKVRNNLTLQLHANAFFGECIDFERP